MKRDLEEKLNQYDDVFLFCNGTKWFETVFAQSNALKTVGRKIWIYSGNGIIYPGNICCRQVGFIKENELLDIYYMYECSDRFHVISRKTNYGSLFNYVDQGLLSAVEMAESLLY